MNWLRRILPKIQTTDAKKVPEGVWHKCDACNAMLYRAELEKNLFVCPKCNHHLRFSARARIASFLDAEGQEELATGVVAKDRLRFRDSKKYKDRISAAHKKTGEDEALITIHGKLRDMPVVVCCFNFEYIGGSMSAGVGERFVQGVNVAINEKIPFICFSTSGGARMQEGLFSLMQMAKTSAALARFSEQDLPYISVLLDPTMGGVSASLATLGDIIIAEPNALIGFSGPRVIEQTIRQSLPEGFQRSEFLLEHGAIDLICDRRQMRDTVANILAKLQHKDEVDILPLAKQSSRKDESDEQAK